MAVKTLEDFFREKQSHKSAKDINWDKRRKEWLGALDRLFKLVTDDYLAKPISKGTVKVDYGHHELSEPFLGTYKVPTLILYVGEEQVTFVPKGRNIVGSTGRVDIRGEMGEATLVLQPARKWMLISQRVPSLILVPFDADALLSVLKAVMRP